MLSKYANNFLPLYRLQNHKINKKKKKEKHKKEKENKQKHNLRKALLDPLNYFTDMNGYTITV